MKVRVFIERSNDGYSAYMPDDNNLPFGLTGDGKTAQEAMQDFLLARDEMKEFFIKERNFLRWSLISAMMWLLSLRIIVISYLSQDLNV